MVDDFEYRVTRTLLKVIGSMNQLTLSESVRELEELEAAFNILLGKLGLQVSYAGVFYSGKRFKSVIDTLDRIAVLECRDTQKADYLTHYGDITLEVIQVYKNNAQLQIRSLKN